MSVQRRFLCSLLGLGLVLGAAACGSEDQEPVGPTASFTVAPVCDLAPAVQVVSTSTEGDAPIVLYVWDFSDGTSALGIAQEHRFPESDTAGVTLTVLDANGLGSTSNQLSTVSPCLSVVSDAIDVQGGMANPTAEIRNDSDYDDALVSFTLDVVSASGIPLALDLDAGQLQIAKGGSVTLFPAAGPVDCGSDCASFAAATVVPHVTSTYWCGTDTCP